MKNSDRIQNQKEGATQHEAERTCIHEVIDARPYLLELAGRDGVKDPGKQERCSPVHRSHSIKYKSSQTTQESSIVCMYAT